MKISKRQQDELDFLCKTYRLKPTEKEIEQFFQWVAFGKNKDTNPRYSKNCLFQAKRKWDMQLKMYIENFHLIPKQELLNEWKDEPYAIKCIRKL